MKIKVVSRQFIKNKMDNNPEWHFGKFIISIFSKDSYSPLPIRFNVLMLNFDDITELLPNESHILFNEEHAKMISEFIKNIPINTNKTLYIHCDAGVSRSGAVGYILNEWFNRYISQNDDYIWFNTNHKHIMPNPLVVRKLKNELFGLPFQNN